VCSKINCSKESFDRFSDNLCEILLSYLSVSESVKFECVSKQWRSLIFNKQNKLIIRPKNFQLIDTIETSYKLWEKNKVSIIKCLGEKLKFIKSLEINFEIDDQLLDIISQKCKSLSKIQIFGFFNEEVCKTLGQKCGQKLKFIDIYGIGKPESVTLLKSTHNLKAIEIYNNFDAVTELSLLKLEQIIINDFSSEWFEKFANLYNKQIMKISFNEWCNDKNSVVSYLLKFENLESLSFTVRKNFYYNWNQIKSLPQNLEKLKLFKIFAFKPNSSFQLFGPFCVKI
jgi:hypothetical protein